MFDIGVNLTSRQLIDNAEELLERAMAAGVAGIAITGTSAEESKQAASLCETLQPAFAGIICATAGVHPHHASEWNEEVRARILDLTKLPQVVAIGETGLDFNRNFSSVEDQLHAFEEQLKLAAETGLPVFLHEREAFDRQIELLRKYRGQISGGVAHCFTGSREQLHAYLDLDLYIGITGWVCDERRGQQLADLIAEIPLHKLMIETDAPWLLPRNIHPKPVSRINEPANLAWISREVANLQGIGELELRDQTFRNALNFFGIKAD